MKSSRWSRLLVGFASAQAKGGRLSENYFPPPYDGGSQERVGPRRWCNTRTAICALVFVILLNSSAFADQALAVFVSKLQNKYQTMDTLQANFSQSYQSKRFSGGGITESGVMYLRKGGLMKWEYQKPEKKVFISDGLFYFYYVPADKQVVKSPVDNQSQQSPALFLAGRGNFAKDFKAEWADPRPGSRLVKLVPVKPQPDFEHLIVEVDPSRYLVLRLLVVDSYQNRTEYKFTSIKENPSLPKNFFVFQAPSGTDVIFQQRDTDQN